MYEILEHTADVGLRLRADSCEQLFEEAARGLFALIVANPDAIQFVEEYMVALEEADPEFLLRDWLDELLFAFEKENLVFGDFSVRLSATGLEAVARGEPFDAERHGMGYEVKAITYHGLHVERTDDGWFAEVIVDI